LVRSRLLQLSSRLHSLGASSSSSAPSAEPPQPSAEGLIEATALCEAALLPLEESVDLTSRSLCEERRRREAAEAEVARLTELLWNFGDRLQAQLGGAAASRDVPPTTEEGEAAAATLAAAAAAWCEDALEQAERALKGRWGLSRSSPKSETKRKDSVDTIVARQLSKCCSQEVVGDGEAVSWEENTAACSICGDALGKRRMNRRHHCRLCGKCVCAACSQSSLQLEGFKGLQRACQPCVSGVRAVPVARARVTKLSERLGRLSGTGSASAGTASAAEPAAPSSPTAAAARPAAGSLEDVLAHCEAVVSSLEDSRCPEGGAAVLEE